MIEALKLLTSNDVRALFSQAYSQRSPGGALGAVVGGEPHGEESLGYL